MKHDGQEVIEISDEIVWSIKMFSPEGWDRLHKIIKKLGVTRYSGQDRLADGYSEFIQIWLEDNGFCFDEHNPDTVKYNKEIFWCECDNEYYSWQRGRSLYQDLVTRYSEYLLGD
jgi:hypothetical protein